MKKVFDMGIGLETILKERDRGVVFLCPICRCEIVFAIAPEDAERVKRHPGIYCPEDEQHVNILINTGSRIDLDAILGLKPK